MWNFRYERSFFYLSITKGEEFSLLNTNTRHFEKIKFNFCYISLKFRFAHSKTVWNNTIRLNIDIKRKYHSLVFELKFFFSLSLKIFQKLKKLVYTLLKETP